ncbi:MAG: DHA2 family efflux MFS transporter permease subunit, partial [Acidimicrobiales bacterium]
PGGRWSVFSVTALGAFLASLDLSIVNVAFPALARSFSHTGRPTLAWVITAYTIAFGALLVTAGRAADRLGRRRIFFTGVVVFLGGSALCGAAPTIGLLIGGRLLQGVGAALLLPASLGLLLGSFPPERRSQVVALWGGIGALAVATGPSLGAVLISAGGWRLAFYVNVPVGIVALVWGRLVLVETAPGTASRLDLAGVLLSAGTLGSLVLAISQGSDWGWSDPRIVGCLVAAAGLGTTFVRRARRRPDGVLDLTLFRSRAFTVANVATVVYAMGFFALLLGNILFLTAVWHYSILRAGLAVAPGPLVVALVAGFAGKLAQRIGFRPVLLSGAAIMTASFAWYATRVGVHPAYVTEWLPATLVTGLGIGATFPVLSAAAVSSLRPDRFAVGGAVNQTARQVGGSLGIAILVAVLGHAQGGLDGLRAFRHLWIYCGATTAATFLVATQLRATRRAARTPRSAGPRRAAGRRAGAAATR